jgi:hypothetical protein
MATTEIKSQIAEVEYWNPDAETGGDCNWNRDGNRRTGAHAAGVAPLPK